LVLATSVAQAQTTVTFRQGVNGYTGTDDTMLQQSATGTNAGSQPTIDIVGGTSVKQGLLRFKNIIGTGTGQIPPNAQILSATLSMNVWTAGSGVAVHKMMSTWTEASTWTSLTGGLTIGDTEAWWTAEDTKTNLATGVATFNVIKAVQDWANGEPNHGFALMQVTSGTTTLRLDSSESTFTTELPRLSITYTAGGGGGGGAPTITAVAPAPGATNVGANGQVNLEVSVSDPNNDPLTVTFYGREKTAGGTPGQDFTLVQIPDTQWYSDNAGRGKIEDFRNMTSWIVSNKNALNVQFVAHMGDLVQDNDDQEQEWINADSAMKIIENPTTTQLPHGIPWGGAPGNHDTNKSGGANRFWNQYFGTSRWNGRTYFRGGYTDGTTDANYQFFSAGGMDFIVINLEYRPSATMIAWADALLKANPTRRGIVTSHEILQAHLDAGTPVDQAPYYNQGRAIYEGLRNNPNFFLMLCGHWHGEGRRTENYLGRQIHAVLCNYQTEANGGDTWLRYLVFSPSKNTITSNVIRTRDGSRRTANDSQFTLNYPMSTSIQADWTSLGTVSVPAGGKAASLSWTGLQSGKEYEWYAAASDGGTPASTAPRSFTPGNNAAPTVALTAPANGATITRPATVDFAATAADTDGTIARVEFFQGSVKVGEDTTSPYAFSWDAPAGTYSLTAVAVDNAGGRTTSPARSVTVTGSGGGGGGTPAPPVISLAYPAANATAAGGSGRVALEASVTDPNADPVTVTFYGRTKATAGTGGDFTIAVMPDTQHYTEANGQYIANWRAQAQWIAANRAKENIVYVAHMGDVTEEFDTQKYEWDLADGVMKLIEDPATTGLAQGVPWSAVPGNHDLNFNGGGRGSNDYYNQYFGPTRFQGRSYFGGGITASDNHCNYTLFSAGGMNFISVNLRHRPTSTMISWANALIQQNASRRAMVTSHEILDDSSGNFTSAGTSIFNGVKANTNLFLLLCGHMHGADGEHRRSDAVGSNTVHTVVQNYQDRAAGGGGWFRTFKFSPATSTISVKTIQATNGNLETDADSQFTLAYPMTGSGGGTPAAWTNLGTVSLASGVSTARLDWTGLTAGTQYEWYAAASDGGTPVSTTERTFTMANNTAPTVALTAPASGAIIALPATVNFTATATDTGGSIARVEFYANGLQVGQDTTSPYAFNWTAPAGSHTLAAVAVDDLGARTTSTSVTVTVTGTGNAAPSVALTAPANGAVITRPALVEIDATASDTDGSVTVVEFFQGATKLGEDTSAPYAFSWDAPAGSYSLTAVAVDNSGARTTSAARSISVVNSGGGSPTPPTISLVYPAADSTAAGGSGRVTLQAAVADANNDPLNVTFYGRPKATGGGEDFTIAVMPDTQYYTDENGRYINNWRAQATWLVNNRVAQNIVYCAHMGDVTQLFDSQKYEWDLADGVMKIIENPVTTTLQHGIPWGAIPGNHDLNSSGNRGSNDYYNQYFGPARFAGRPYFGGGITANDNHNNYTLFTAGGMDFVVVNLRHRATSTMISWGNGILNQFPNRRGIVTCHEIINDNGASWSGSGQAIFDGLKNNPNLFLMLCGHKHEATGENRRSDVVSGRTIHTIVQDYQDRSGGGGGWFRTYKFSPANNNISARTINAVSGATETDANSQFTISYSMSGGGGGGTPGPWVALGTVALPAGAPTAYLDWTGLTAGSQYEWYAAVSDGGTPVSTSPRSFTLANNTAPTVALSSPAAGATISLPATVDFAATASDTGGSITRVEFYANGNLVGQDTTSPYAFSWSAPLGSHTLSAVAVDNNGARTTSATRSVTVVTGNNPPVVALTSPTNGAVIALPNSVNLAATATDSDGSIARVEFFNGATKLGEDTTSPFTFTWNAGPGTHSLTAVAEDNSGTRVTATAVSVTVTNAPPAVTLTAPANGSSFRAGDILSLAALASDTDGTVQRVEFFSGATKLGEDTLAPFAFSWAVPAGTHVLTAAAVDNYGARTVSASVTITATTNAPPTVTLTAPTNGQSIPLPNPVNLAANAADPDGTVAKVEFWQGTTMIAEDVAAPYSFTWSAPPGTYTLTAVAQDNNNARTTSSAVTITVTNRAPQITLDSPASGTTFTLPDVVELTATASDDDSAISRVEFYAGATKIGQDSFPPYALNWTPPAAGPHTLTAVAVDEHNAQGTSAPATITVVNPPPVIAIVDPEAGSTVNLPGPFTILAEASDADGTVTKVEFFAGTSKLGEVTAAPFTFGWRPISGTYSLTARAHDNLGAQTTSAPVAVTVANPNNTAPSVALTYPSDGQQLPSNAPVTLTAAASDADGVVSKLEFYQGATKLGEDLTAPYTLVWPGAAAGNYEFTVTATDNDGGTATSEAVQVTLMDNLPPTITLSAPANAQNFTGSTVALSAVATDSDGTVTKVEFYRGTTKIGEDLSAPFTFSWTGVTNGAHVITAVATDDDGARASSRAARITVSAPQTLTFQQGTNGYTGGLDTGLRGAAPSTSLGASSTLTVDGDDSGSQAQILLRFDNLVGTAASQIPAGATVTSATLTVQVMNQGSGFAVHRMIAPWSESSTWNSLVNGVSANGTEAVATPVTSAGANNSSANVTTGSLNLTITSAVQEWVNGTANQGLVLLPYASGSDGVDIYTKEWATLTQRPRLSVTFTAAPRDAAPLIVNEVFRGAPAAVASTEPWHPDDAVEFLLTQDLTAAELMAYTFGDSDAATAAKTTAWRFQNLESLAPTFRAGTLITVAGPGAAQDLSYSPVQGANEDQWNLQLTAGGGHVALVERASSATFTIDASNDAVWVDSQHTALNDLAISHGVVWDDPLSGGIGAFTSTGTNLAIAHLTAPSRASVAYAGGSGQFFNGTKFSASGEASLGAPNSQGDNAAYISTLRQAAPGDMPLVTIAATDAIGGEFGADKTIVFTIARSAPLTAAITVNLTAAGTATSGADYSGFTNTLAIPANAPSATLTLTVLKDNRPEGPEKVRVTVASGTGYAVGSPATAEATILDRPVHHWIHNKVPHHSNRRELWDDDDDDGECNLVEYFKGSSAGDSRSRHANTALPGARGPKFRFTRARDLPDASGTVTWSRDLKNWFASGASNGGLTVTLDYHVVSPSGEEPETVEANSELSGAAAANPGPIFYRLEVISTED
jgi:hypothetical protein